MEELLVNRQGDETMSSILSILKKWGIDIPQGVDYLDYLKQTNPNNFYFIDQCPFSVGEKHSQIEMLFQEVLEGKISKSSFLSLEKKYRNILTKLWLYNDLLVESNILDIKVKNKSKKIDKQYLKLFPKLYDMFTKSDFINILEREQLELLVQLGVRDIIYAAFYFKDYELIIVPSWSCFVAYFNDLSKIEIVKEIVTTEGLYLRHTNQ